jgi:hypothetical protein
MTTRSTWIRGVVIAGILGAAAVGTAVPGQQRAVTRQAARDGATTTRLADGRWLVLGGGDRSSPSAVASIVDRRTGTTRNLPAGLLEARTGHAATLLSDGRVLITGGIGASGEALSTVEQFDPDTESFASVSMMGAEPRAFHSATLLTDGSVLVAGGLAVDASADRAELWSVDRGIAVPLQSGTVNRSSHGAALLADGRVLLTGGVDGAGQAATMLEIVDPSTGAVAVLSEMAGEPAGPLVTAAWPGDGATDVPVSATVVMRVSPPLQADSVTSETIRLTGPGGVVLARLVPAEGGRLLFLHPLSPLEPDTFYTFTMEGVVGIEGTAFEVSSLTFRTAAASGANAPIDEGVWGPDAVNGWRTNLPPSPWQRRPPLVAEPGVTAVSGHVLTLQGIPLKDVTLAIDGDSATTDENGQFLLRLTTAGAGRHELEIDGSTANRGGRTYGFFEYGMTVAPGVTTTLPFTIWMPRLDRAHRVRIPVPTTREVVVTTPLIPGLELRIPPGTVIRDHDGAPVSELSITPIPVDRPPFPLARNVDVPIYFTIQPGNAYLYSTRGGPQRAPLVYPNYSRANPGQLAQFWVYDPEEIGWHVYSAGQVTRDGRQVVPDPGAGIYEFSGAMMSPGMSPASSGPKPWWWPFGDPVDPATGLFVLEKTDLYLPDVQPIALTRT